MRRQNWPGFCYFLFDFPAFGPFWLGKSLLHWIQFCLFVFSFFDNAVVLFLLNQAIFWVVSNSHCLSPSASDSVISNKQLNPFQSPETIIVFNTMEETIVRWSLWDDSLHAQFR